MDHVIASAGLRLRYLCAHTSIQNLDLPQIADDLAEPTTRHAMAWWFATARFTDFDHVVIATDCESNRCVAMLVGVDGATGNETFLDLQAGFVVSAMNGSMLLRRMLAYAISRISLFGTVPQIVAARTTSPACYRMLSLFADIVPGSSVFPQTDATVVDLRMAGLARRIARRLSPTSEYDAATGTIRTNPGTAKTCFARNAGIEASSHAMFERNIGTGDQILVVLDMRQTNRDAITSHAERLVLKRWKGPTAASRRRVGVSARPSLPSEAPTLSA